MEKLILKSLKNIFNSVITLIIILLAQGCSSHKTNGVSSELKREEQKSFNFVDINGNYHLKRKRNFLPRRNNLILKNEVLSKDVKKKLLEKNITISEFGYLNYKGQKSAMLRPVISQHTVWLEGKKYFNQMKVNKKNRSLDVILVTPERKWRGKQSHRFPESKGLYCFFSQLVECVSSTNFISQSESMKRSAVMPVTIIWDGYPFIQEQYSDIPNEVFTRGKVLYEGKMANGGHRLVLQVANNAIAYQLGKNLEFKKMFWVSQGITIEDSSL